MTEQEIAALKALAQAATPGPWKDDRSYLKGPPQSYNECYFTNPSDAAYIAAANPATILSLIAELEAMRKERAWISVEDARKPAHSTPVLLAVRTLDLREDEEGQYGAREGMEIAMGEYAVTSLTDDEPYRFACYTSPMSDNDWITHWMPLPAAPSTDAS